MPDTGALPSLDFELAPGDGTSIEVHGRRVTNIKKWVPTSTAGVSISIGHHFIDTTGVLNLA